jgi:undecaprenyl-diphosphatase
MPITTLGLNDPEQSEKPMPLITAAVVASLVASVLFLLLFAWIATEMREGDTKHFDAAVRSWLHSFASPTLTKAMFAFSFMGDRGMVVFMSMALALFVYQRWWRGLLWLSITMVGALVLNTTLKLAFARTRPEPFFGTLPHSYSFPSGHSLFSFCFYGVLAGLIMARIRSRWLRVLTWSAAAIMVLLIGISRIYLGVHYPSDVIAGYLAGAIWVSAMVTVDRLRRTRKGLKLATVNDPVDVKI